MFKKKKEEEGYSTSHIFYYFLKKVVNFTVSWLLGGRGVSYIKAKKEKKEKVLTLALGLLRYVYLYLLLQNVKVDCVLQKVSYLAFANHQQAELVQRLDPIWIINTKERKREKKSEVGKKRGGTRAFFPPQKHYL